MGSKVGRNGKIRIKGWRPHLLLHPCKVGCFPSYQRNEHLSRIVAPRWQLVLIFSIAWSDEDPIESMRVRTVV